MRDFAEMKPRGPYEAAIGEKNQDYYVDKFEDFDQQGPGLKLGWNWAAFFFGGLWALYRKMYGWFFVWLVVATVAKIFESASSVEIHQVLAVAICVFWLGFAAFANSLYHAKVKARVAAAQQSNSDSFRASWRLRTNGGVNRWVPIVFAGIPVIGIVAAVGLPAYQDYTKRQASSERPIDEPIKDQFGGTLVNEPVANIGAQQQSPKRSQIDDFLDRKIVNEPVPNTGAQQQPPKRSEIEEFLNGPSSNKPHESTPHGVTKLKPFYGKIDEELAQAGGQKSAFDRRRWSGNDSHRFECVGNIERRARRLFPKLNEPRAWAAVIAWQANHMRDGKTAANVALYDAVSTVLDGLNDNHGVCRPGPILKVDAAQASKDFPTGAELTPLECDR